MAQSWETLLKTFLLYKRANQTAQRTLDDYEYHVRRFFSRFPHALEDHSALEQACLEYFAADQVAPATFNTRRKCLRAFFRWLRAKGVISADPLQAVAKRREDPRPRPADEALLERLLSLPDRSRFAGLRDYTLLLLTLDTGIRPKEAFGLLPCHFHLAAHKVEVPAEIAKTRVGRVLPILPQTAAAVEELLGARHPGWPDTVPVFCTEDGRPLNRTQWARRMREYSAKLGKRITPYQLRHSFAVMYLRRGANAHALQHMLGHATLEMARRYVEVAEQDLAALHQHASPLGSLLPRKGRVRKVTPSKDRG